MRELLRLRLLQLLEAASVLGIRTNVLMTSAVSEGFHASLKEIADEIAYLVDKKFVEEVAQAISPELRRWRITADGRDFLAMKGLA